MISTEVENNILINFRLRDDDQEKIVQKMAPAISMSFLVGEVKRLCKISMFSIFLPLEKNLTISLHVSICLIFVQRWL